MMTRRRRKGYIIFDFWTGTELSIGAFFSFIYAVFATIVGGIDAPVQALCVFVILDVITGLIASAKRHELESSIGRRGMIKKVGIFAIVGFCTLLDTAMSTSMARGMAITGFSIVEAISICENIEKMGYGYIIPAFMKSWLIRIQAEKHIVVNDEVIEGEDKKE